ncbi:MAG: hypothetical protein KDE23_19315 [Caldilinea sp.]|nr:hypothetical protein [Caldilinea sp.]
MKARIMIALALMLGALFPVAVSAATSKVANSSEELATFSSSTFTGPCAPGATYESACDVNHDGGVDVFDIQLTAGRWGQTGTWMSDNDHTHLGQTWIGSNNALKISGSFGSPDYAAMVLSNSTGHGLRTASANGSGVWVNSAGTEGVWVQSAGGDGVAVSTAGGDGVFVSTAGGDGVYVSSATHYGLHVGSAGNDGLWVENASGVGVWANTTQANGEWGFYTPDKIRGSNVTLESLSLVAQVSGLDGLTAGDLVTAAGVAEPLSGSTVHVPLVRLADGAATGVVGVVESRLVLVEHGVAAQPVEEEAQSEPSPPELRSTAGPAQPGDYVALTIYGAAQVKVQNGEALQPGQRVTVGADGAVRALQTRTVEGMEVSEGAATLGVVLEAPKDGMVWVLVNPQ